MLILVRNLYLILIQICFISHLTPNLILFLIPKFNLRSICNLNIKFNRVFYSNSNMNVR